MTLDFLKVVPSGHLPLGPSTAVARRMCLKRREFVLQWRLYKLAPYVPLGCLGKKKPWFTRNISYDELTCQPPRTITFLPPQDLQQAALARWSPHPPHVLLFVFLLGLFFAAAGLCQAIGPSLSFLAPGQHPPLQVALVGWGEAQLVAAPVLASYHFHAEVNNKL